MAKHLADLDERGSGKEQEREGFSIPSHLKLLRGYAEARGVELVREFVGRGDRQGAGTRQLL